MKKEKELKKLNRTAFTTSRLLDFCSEKELTAQTGHARAAWPLVILKELVDNALDAAEDVGIAPAIEVKVDQHGILVADNGPGIPPETIEGILDFSVRVSSREAYTSLTRGAQGNALKTITAMPFVLDGEQGRADIIAGGVCHAITMQVDRIRQNPVIDHQKAHDRRFVKNGTVVRVCWPDSACSILESAEERFLQIAADYTFMNPHLTLEVDWFGRRISTSATDPGWPKWLPSSPTSPHWYTTDRFERLVGAYLARDADRGTEWTVRELVFEFDGLITGTAKQKAVLEATGLTRTSLAALRNGDGLDHDKVARLLAAMKDHAKPIKPASLGIIGRDHLAQRFAALGCEMKTFEYRKLARVIECVPRITEAAFAWHPDSEEDRRLITGVNWSPGILNPFRELGKNGPSLDSILEQQRAGRDEPVILFLHFVCPRVDFTDRGKGAVVIDCEQEEE